MRRLSLFTAAWLGGLCASAQAADPGRQPTRLEEVVVTATRTNELKGRLTKAVSVVTSEQIEAQQDRTVLDTLRIVPGVFVRQSGGLGRTASAVVRGNIDKQTLVLVDGVPGNSPTLGNFNLATIPTDFVDRIEVLRGSASTLYGSEAIGGVVNIITKRGEGPMHTAYQQEFGTERTFRETLATQAGAGPWRYTLGIGRVDSNGRSTGDDVEVTHIAATGGVELGHALSLDVALNNNNARVGIDDGSFRPDPNRMTTHEELMLSATLTATPMERWRQELRFYYHNDETSDIDPPDPGTTQANADSRINTDRYGMDWIHYMDTGRIGHSTTGFQWKYDAAESRTTNSIRQWAWFFQHQLDPIDRLALIGGVRINRHTLFGAATTGEASASYRVPVTDTRLRANFSQGFRAPTLNDLFFPNFGNQRLSPERSRMFELGAGQEWWGGRAGADVTWYYTRVNDLIQAVSVTQTASQARNIARARMTGVELETHVQATEALRLTAAWTYTNAFDLSSKDHLVRIPANTISLTADYALLKDWRVNLQTLLVSHQEESPGANNRQRVKEYGRIDAALSYQATKWLRLYGRIENLLNRKYSEVLGFPAAGALFFVGGKLDV